MALDLQKEAELIEKAKLESSAFIALYELNLPQIYRYVYYRTGNRQDTEDIVSQTFLQALEKLHTYEPKGIPFCHWLYRIANHLIYHRNKQRARERKLLDGWSAETITFQPEHVEILALLSTLPDLQQRVLTLRYVQDLSIKEVAGILERSPGAIKQICFRALRSIRARMEDEHDAI